MYQVFLYQSDDHNGTGMGKRGWAHVLVVLLAGEERQRRADAADEEIVRDAGHKRHADGETSEAERDRCREGLGVGPVRLREESGQRRARVDDLLFDPLDGGVAEDAHRQRRSSAEHDVRDARGSFSGVGERRVLHVVRDHDYRAIELLLGAILLIQVVEACRLWN